MWRLPHLEIRKTPAGFLAVSSTGEETPLWPTAQLREQVSNRLKYGALTGVQGNPDEAEAAAMLSRCELRYEALPSDAVGVVIVAPDELVAVLRNYEHRPPQLLMTTLYDTCSVLGGDRVVPQTDEGPPVE